MKKKLLSALLSVAMVSSLLVGCGGSNETAAPAETKEEAPAEETKEEAPAEDAAEEAPAEDAAASGDKFYIYSWNKDKYIKNCNKNSLKLLTPPINH